AEFDRQVITGCVVRHGQQKARALLLVYAANNDDTKSFTGMPLQRKCSGSIRLLRMGSKQNFASVEIVRSAVAGITARRIDVLRTIKKVAKAIAPLARIDPAKGSAADRNASTTGRKPLFSTVAAAPVHKVDARAECHVVM